MRAEATRELQKDKDSGKRSKQITDADVDSMCAMLHPDEYKAQEVRRREVKVMEESMAHLTEMWGSKCRSLQTMVGKQR